jgi:adenylyl- and sulfurtransferase ThiI
VVRHLRKCCQKPGGYEHAKQYFTILSGLLGSYKERIVSMINNIGEFEISINQKQTFIFFKITDGVLAT